MLNYIDCESVYSSSTAVKQTSETLRKKLIRYLCFIPVDFIHSHHYRLKKSNFILERQISVNRSDLLAIMQLTIAFTILNCLEHEFLKGFLVQGRQQSFPSFQISWICSDVFQINDKFIHNCPPCFLAEMAKVASSVARPRKCYINRLERFICIACFQTVKD